MIDIKLIREQPDEVKAALARRNVDSNVIDDLLAVDRDRRLAQADVEERQSRLNALSKEVGRQFGQKKIELIQEASGLSEAIEHAKPKLEELDTRFAELLKSLPNLPDPDVPDGADESENIVIRTVGKQPKFDFAPKEHWQLGEALGVLDTATAAKVAGSRFVYLKGQLATLQFALIQLALSVLTDEAQLAAIIKKSKLKLPATPFTLVVPPAFIKPEVFDRMARLNPRDERYYLPADDLFLIGSAEHTLGPLHMGQTLDEADLPIRYLGYSSSFRREAGSYGKDTKGILRLHQFDKLEMESFTLPEHSRAEQDLFVAIQEHLMQSLGLPYQVMAICTGDMGDPDARQFDINTWMPGQNQYRETQTADLMTDYQAHRLGTKVKRKDKSSQFVHMNDGTAFAIGRTLIAIMENYQQKDGTILVPDVLKPYVPFTLITRMPRK